MVPLFLLPLLAASTAAFTVPNPRVVPTISDAATAYYSTPPTRSCPSSVIWRRQMAASDGNDEAASTAPSPPPIKRRKRKDGNTFSPPSSLLMESESVDIGDAMSATASTRTDSPPEETRPAPAATPPTANNVLVMKVRDIRDVVSGAPESPTYDEEEGAYDDAEGEEEDGEEGADDIDDGDELADDEEWEYYDVDEDGREIVASSGRQRSAGGDASSGGTRNDPIDQLLADARRMRASSEGQSQTKTKGVKEIIFEVISTIVTVDFFLVLALLVWFLAGIFCSYVLKDDAVQIAFNMNFERLTQP